MIKILHRVNNPDELKKIPKEFGVEMDLHAWGSSITVHHDAFKKGFNFNEWLDAYDHAFAIFNIKEEGIENVALNMINERGVKSFFFLDLSFPSLVKMINAGEKRVAIRISEYESIEVAKKFSGQAKWIWIDIFKQFNLPKNDYKILSECGYKFCLVSPELHGRDPREIISIKSEISKFGYKFDAICTKIPNAWD